jgi:hypothetical protein
MVLPIVSALHASGYDFAPLRRAQPRSMDAVRPLAEAQPRSLDALRLSTEKASRLVDALR